MHQATEAGFVTSATSVNSSWKRKVLPLTFFTEQDARGSEYVAMSVTAIDERMRRVMISIHEVEEGGGEYVWTAATLYGTG